MRDPLLSEKATKTYIYIYVLGAFPETWASMEREARSCGCVHEQTDNELSLGEPLYRSFLFRASRKCLETVSVCIVCIRVSLKRASKEYLKSQSMRRQRVGHVMPSLARFARSLRRNRSGRETCQGPLRETLERFLHWFGSNAKASKASNARTPTERAEPQPEQPLGVSPSHGRTWGPSGAASGHLGPFWEPPRSLLGASWRPPGSLLEASWEPLS